MPRMTNALQSIAVAATVLLAGSLVSAQPPVHDTLPAAPTVKLTQEQRHIIREIILKDLKVQPQAANVPTKIGEKVPDGVALQPIPVEVSAKVPQIRTHAFYVKDDHVIVVDPKDNRVADVMQ